MIELSKSDYIWFSKFLNEYLRLKKTHVLNGIKVSDSTLKNMYDMTQITPIKGGVHRVPIDNNDAQFLVELLEDCVMCCPGCSLTSLRYRKSVSNKILRLIDEIKIGDI